MLKSIKSKITYRNKTYFGILTIIIGFVLGSCCCRNYDIFDFVLLMIPGIFLCIPSERIKNSKILGYIFIFGVLLIILLSILGILHADQMMIANDFMYKSINGLHNETILEIQVCYFLKFVYGIVCLIASGMFLIPTKKEE